MDNLRVHIAGKHHRIEYFDGTFWRPLPVVESKRYDQREDTIEYTQKEIQEQK